MNLICRTCMQINKNHINIFEYCETSKTLSDMILECTTIKIQRDDALPLYICNSCLKKLTSAWDFRVMVIKTDSKLKNIFNKHVTENIVQNNDASTHTVIVKEKPVIIKTCTLSDENVNKNAEKFSNVNFAFNESANFIQKKNNQDVEKTENVNKCNSGKCINNSISKNNILKINVEETTSEHESEKECEYVGRKNTLLTKITSPKTCAPERTTFIKKKGKESEYKGTKNKSSSLNNVVQKIVLDSLDPRSLPSKAIIRYCILDKNIREIQENTEMQENMLNEGHIENTTFVANEDQPMNEILPRVTTDQDNSEESANEVDKDMMDIELYSQDKISKLTSVEKEQTFIFCRICNRPFRYKYYFGMHVRLHNGDRHKKCDICGKTFVWLFQLQSHMAVHSKLRPFSCKICGKTFKTKNCLHSHRIVHLDNTPYSCITCQKTFKTKNLLRIHFQRHKNEKKYTCEICGKSFSDPSSIYTHKYTHSDEKDVPCPTCGKIYANNLSLRRHLRLHREVRPFSCKYCNRSFRRKCSRDEHTSIHTGEKPFSCKICGKTFRHSASLYNHMRIHKREAPYACEICPSQFKYSRHLQNHMKLHE